MPENPFPTYVQYSIKELLYSIPLNTLCNTKHGMPKRESAGGGGVPSSRAKRLAAGKFDLADASGELDADYETVGVLGRGSFAEINLLRHRERRTLFALKTCAKLDAPSYSHLRTEAELMSRLNHPFILSPLKISNPPGRATNFGMLLPLCPGGDLLQLLRRQPGHRLCASDARMYTAMVVLGLRAMHKANLAYRDLKPDNLLIRPNGYLMLADFGFTSPLSQCGRVVVGTPLYQAPELIRKQKHGAAVDWWALGVLLIELLSGEPPFAADDDEATQELVLNHRGGVPREAEALAPLGLPAAALALAAALLQPSPSDRLGSQGGGEGGGEGGGQGGGQGAGQGAGERAGDAVQAHAWFEGVRWDALEEMSLAAPHVPEGLEGKDDDAMLLQLTQRCQSGFN